MFKNVPLLLSKAIDIQFHLLFVLTPLIFFPHSFELFEFNKMILVYLLTITICSSWIIRMLILGRIQIPRTPLDIPILILLITRVLSTIFSIDPHTSLWGYYSRYNEGLFSTFAYVLLYYAAIAHFNKKSKLTSILFSFVAGAVLTCLWGIPGHFGTDFSCLLINKQFAVNCWQAGSNPMTRLYSTLGQPNWFAAYIAYAIPLVLSYLVIYARVWAGWTGVVKKLFVIGVLGILYAGFTFAYSRGATLGLVAGIGVWALGLVFLTMREKSVYRNLLKAGSAYLLIGIGVLAIISLVFGTAFTNRPVKLQNTQTQNQLETEGTESGQIRLIVWKGALEVFKHYPILGSGVETFAYSYYMYRPAEHNATTEWSFIYNKAHNEYLNTLATTGSVGLVALLIYLGSVLLHSARALRSKLTPQSSLFILGLSGGFVSIWVQNSGEFLVVLLSLMTYLTPALIFSFIRAEREEFDFYSLSIPKNTLFPKISFASVITIALILLNYMLNFWKADLYFSLGNNALGSANLNTPVELLRKAIALHGNEPYYHSQLAVALAEKGQSTKSSGDVKEAVDEGLKALSVSPYNLSFYKNMHWIYEDLGSIDSKYYQLGYDNDLRARKIAPTDPSTAYYVAQSQEKLGSDTNQTIQLYQHAIDLKYDWVAPRDSLAQFYKNKGQKDKAIEEYEKIVQIYPNAEDIKAKIDDLKKAT